MELNDFFHFSDMKMKKRVKVYICVLLCVVASSSIFIMNGHRHNVDITQLSGLLDDKSTKNKDHKVVKSYIDTGIDNNKCGLAKSKKNITWPWIIREQDIGDFQIALEKVVHCVPASDYKTVAITVIDRGFVEMLESYLYHVLKYTRLYPILFITMDRVTDELLQRRGLFTFLNMELGRIAASHSGFQTNGWRRKGHVKFKMATIAVNLGYSVLVTDMDISYFKDPFPYLTCRKCDIEIQADQDLSNSPVNSGFVFFRPTRNAKRFLVDLSGHLESHPWFWDQNELDSKLIAHMRENGLIRRVLPFELFTPAKIHEESVFMYYTPPIDIFKRVVLVHHLHQAYEGKIFRMRELGLWTSDENKYYSDTKGRYITYENPLEILKDMEWNILTTAFKLAAVLNRKLILPRFHCLRKRACPAERFGIHGNDRNCYCSIIHHLQDTLHRNDYDLFIQFEQEHNGMFREHTFLDHNLVPSEITKSVSKTMIIESNLVRMHPELREGVQRTYVPRDIISGPTQSEVLHWFDPMKDIAVLKFKSLYGNFQI